MFVSGCPNFLSGQLKVRLCWLNCFCTLASRVCFFMFSLSLSLSLPFFFSVSVSVFYIEVSYILPMEMQLLPHAPHSQPAEF